MLTIKRSVAIIAILFSPLSTASNLTSQLHNFFSAQLAGVSDEVRVSIRTAPNLLPPCEQPLLSMSNNSRLWGNVNVLARCGNDKRYLQVNVQATGNYVVAAMPIVRGGKAWRVKAGQRVNVIASGDGFSANAEGQALNNAAVAQNARVRMVSGQVVSGVVDADGNILINL